MTEELIGVVSSPEYVLIVLGYAAYTFVVAGLGNFGPIFVIGLGLISDETTASLTFGAIIAVVGFSGTLVGGLVIDYMMGANETAQVERLGIPARIGTSDVTVTRGDRSRRSAEMVKVDSNGALLGMMGEDEEKGDGNEREYRQHAGVSSGVASRDAGAGTGTGPSGGSTEGLPSDDAVTLRSLDLKLNSTTPLIMISTAVGFLLCFLSPFFASSKVGFLGVLGLGAFSLFLNTAAVNLAILASVPPESRPFAVGIGIVVTHAFGDVPSPVIIG